MKMSITRKRVRLLLPLAIGVLAVGSGITNAVADNHKSAPDSRAAGSVPGYQYVVSASIANPNNAQTFGSVFCPDGRPVTGGGVFHFSGSVNAEVNSTFPIDGGDADSVSDDGWGAWVNNHSGAASSFQVWAICRIPSP